MKKLLTKDIVAKAMAQMKSDGQKVTLTKLHAILGGHGSMTTLMRLKSEVELEEAQETAAPDSPEALQAFKGVWALGVEFGRKQQEAINDQLGDDQKALAAENERLDGLVAAGANYAAQLLETGTRLEIDLKVANAALLDATEQAKLVLMKLSAVQTAHADEINAVRRELDIQVGKSHDLELELVRAKAHLDARGAKSGNL